MANMSCFLIQCLSLTNLKHSAHSQYENKNIEYKINQTLKKNPVPMGLHSLFPLATTLDELNYFL